MVIFIAAVKSIKIFGVSLITGFRCHPFHFPLAPELGRC
jgi:hypothetical protein